MSEAEAIESLTELGLTEYEARCFVALTRLSQGTAKEISQVADVPQSRVYDVVDRLHKLGLVDVQESEPRQYVVMPVDLARKRLHQEFRDHLETASTHLQALETRDTGEDGAWEIASQQDIHNRTLMHVDHATDDIYLLVSDEELLDSDLLESLSNARDRGVTVRAEVPSESARDRLYDGVNGVQVVVSSLPFGSLLPDDRVPGRLLMVDDDTILMSALREGLVPNETEETGLWGREIGHGLVVWLHQLLESRADHLEFETTAE